MTCNWKPYTPLLLFMTLLMTLFIGCVKELPPNQFLKAYEHAALVEQDMGGYRFALMSMTPDYILARNMDSTWDKAEKLSFSKRYHNSHYFSLRISPANLTGGPEDLSKDILGRALIGGQISYDAMLHFLQNDLAAYVTLELPNGKIITPQSYRYERGYALGGAQSFLFLFPKMKDGAPVTLRGSHFKLHDFGLNIGTLTLPIKTATSMALKV